MDIALASEENIDILNEAIIKSKAKNLRRPIWIKQILRFTLNKVQ